MRFIACRKSFYPNGNHQLFCELMPYLCSSIKNMIHLLACPLCGGELSLTNAVRHQGEVQRGTIQCNKSGHSFRIVARIPIFLPPEKFADWTHPLVEVLFGNIRRGLEELIEEHGVEKIKRMYSALMKGDYQPPIVVSDSPVDKSLVAQGGYRISKRAVEKHLERIKRQCTGKKSIEKHVRFIAELKPRIIVDACCGGGFFIASLLKKFQKYEKLFSFDVDYNCAKRVEGIFRHLRLIDRSLPMVADVRMMPFPANSLELVTTYYGVSQVLGYSKALQEIFRVLQPGGYFVVTDKIHLGKPIEGFTLEELTEIHRFSDIYVDAESFVGALENIGFSINEAQRFASEGRTGSLLVICTKPR